MTRLTVAVRVRPLSDREISTKSVSIVSVENGKTVAVTNVKVPEQHAGDSRERIRRFTFDYCFDSKATQEDVYQNIGKEIAKAVQKRFHSCILAYGQSSSGKTHTMIGMDEDAGLAPRICRNLFNYLEETAVGNEAESLNATVSYLEIYNEKVRDLLEPDLVVGSALKVREHPKKGPYVQGLCEKPVLNSDELLDYLQIGNSNRTVGATNANPRSSRSHSVFTFTCCNGLKLRLVDLAGSERAGSRSHATSRFREGANINRSLVALRNVISALADGSRLVKLSRKRFIPYRDSTLTWLLKDTLGGNSKTILISNISPSSHCYNETVNTLRFGQRAKQIIVQPLVNEDPKERTIRELRAEITKLRELLASTKVSELGFANQASERVDDVSWEQAEEFGSDDSGFTSSTASFDEVEIENEVVVDKPKPFFSIVDHLIPVMDVTSDPAKAKPKSPLRRTFSMDQRGGSQEKRTSLSSLPGTRKASIDKAAGLKRTEKGVATETKGFARFEVKSKIDSYRKPLVKPRSQIVAAVTQRLYNKVKKKDMATDTLDINEAQEEVPKELSICSNARLRLQELTQKALKAHRRKHAETQTELFPVLRVKEISTDVDDLQIVLEEVKHADTATEDVPTRDAATNCTLLDTLVSGSTAIVLTRSCGTSTDPEERPQTNPISFRKYLQEQPKPNFEVVHSGTGNPIYTTSVNINVNHNYIGGGKSADSISDDSLEEQLPTIYFPTPDLLSNHNSLEQAGPSYWRELRFPSTGVITESAEVCEDLSLMYVACACTATTRIVPGQTETLDSVEVQTTFACEICRTPEDCGYFYNPPPQTYTATPLTEPLKGQAQITQPQMGSRFETMPDSLGYHHEKKKVRFEEAGMQDAMTKFMSEVTVLMSNLTKVASRFELAEQEYDLEVTVSGLPKHKCKRKKSKKRGHRTLYSESTQTSPVRTENTATYTETELLPPNKYEASVESSCDRLERLVHRIETRTREEYDLHKFPQPIFINNDWNYRPDDSSLESNLTFSDYGSLPRRAKPARERHATCSPSGYLRQLTSMRKQIVETSREELMNEAQMHL